jgi:quercetin dioxygenase-like cupin family protein
MREIMTETLTLNGSERITIIDSTPERFEVEATYAPHGERPPRHVHPSHAESFTVLAGALRVELAGRQSDHPAGESFEIPSGVAHRMWNAGEEPATVRWISTPAGRVESFFRAMDALHRAGTTDLVSKAGVLRAHSDVMLPSSLLTRLLVRLLGRMRPAPTPATPVRTEVAR